MRALAIESLAIRSFRNLEEVDLAPSPRFNVVSGDNGQGKTNLLEAIYVVATSKSFRASKPGDVVRHGAELASVRARVREDDETREQAVGLKPGARAAKINGKAPPSLASYAVRTPVIVFHPGEVSLSMGGGADRRKLLDRLALYLSPQAMDDLERYGRAMRERQRALDTRGPSASDAEPWEAVMAEHGVRLMAARADATSCLAPAAEEAFARIAAPGLSLSVQYAPGGPVDAEDFRKMLVAMRPADARRGAANRGPHRDDLALVLDGRPARGIASQGQHRAIVLSLKSAEVFVIGEARATRPILLLDDVSSELDRARTASLFAFLREQHGQVFLSTTRQELIEIAGVERSDFIVEGGRLRPG